MDKTAEGLPFDPTIRIPPIQDPSPLQVVSNRRPSPLEPRNAEVRRSTTTVHLTSRSKALSSARPVDGNTPIKPLDTRHIPHQSSSQDEEQQQQQQHDVAPRKRQKVDYVQLPQPHHHHKSSERVSSLESIPRLNQLNEPPPSAARFPPITINGGFSSQRKDAQQAVQSLPDSARQHFDSSETNQGRVEFISEDVTKKAKRVYTRGRRNWTEEETDNLLKGVAKYGVGKWKKIMQDKEFNFPSDRTAVDLKDRYRTCKMHEERRIERHANGDPNPDQEVSNRRQSKSSKSPQEEEHPSKEPSPKAANDLAKTKKKKKSDPAPTINFAEVNTVQDVAKSLEAPKPESKRWTAEEDANLSKGFQKYGFSWSSISKDAGLQLQHRTGVQLRDRFRIKFPIHYQTSVPVEQPPEAARKRDRNGRQRRRTADPKEPKGGIRLVLATPDDMKGKTMDIGQSPFEQRSNKTLTIADMTDSPLGQSGGSKPSLPSMSSLVARVDAQPLPDLTQHPVIDIQPLPDSDEELEESEYEEYESEQELAGREADLGPLSDVYEDGDVRGGNEVRHLSISGLLNESSEDVFRLPPFRSYDETNELLEGTVNLPPLLWDDLAPRPMFEID